MGSVIRFVWIRSSSKAISDIVKGHCSQCIKRQWLLVIILTAWASSSPLLYTTTVICPHLLTLTPYFPSTTIPNITRMSLCPVAVVLTNQTFLTVFNICHTQVAGFWICMAITACVMNQSQKMETLVTFTPFQSSYQFRILWNPLWNNIWFKFKWSYCHDIILATFTFTERHDFGH